MVNNNNDKKLSKLLKAMSDETRRSLLTKLVQQGACRVTDLSAYYEMSLNAISKHLKVLEKADLIKRNKVGRIHWIEADLTQVAIVESWFNELKSIWELRLDRLDIVLKEEKMNELELKVSKIIAAPIEKVFNAWLDPKTLAKFMQPMDGMSDAIVTTDAKEGGRFTIVMLAGDNKMPHEGKYVEIDRLNRLVFTWETDCSADGSTVTLDFTETDDKHTKIELRHVKFIDEETRDNHIGGWTGILDALDTVVK